MVHARTDFDDLLRRLMVLGFASLVAWTLTGLLGTISGALHVDAQATLRFCLAVLIVTFARRTYWEMREWFWRRLSPDERYGFASPIHENPRSYEARDQVAAETT